MKNMVMGIRNIELAISGGGVKEPSESEKPNLVIARKSIHLSRNLKAGAILKREDLIMKRPGDGISPMDYENVLGKTLISDVEEDFKLNWEVLNS